MFAKARVAEQVTDPVANACREDPLFKLGCAAFAAKNYGLFLQLHTQAASQGNFESMYELGAAYDLGNGVKQDYRTAASYYARAAAKGSAKALGALGVLYYYGQGVVQDYVKAMDSYQKSLAKGNLYVLFNIGILYERGCGVPRDYIKAREYFERAAANEDANKYNAYAKLGHFYLKGTGVAINPQKAQHYFEELVLVGIRDVFLPLAEAYEGSGDTSLAVQCRAAATGSGQEVKLLLDRIQEKRKLSTTDVSASSPLRETSTAPIAAEMQQLSIQKADRTLIGQNGIIHAVTYSPDGRLLASGSNDQTIKLWRVDTGECIATFRNAGEGFCSGLLSLVFSPDGQMLLISGEASGAGDRTLKIWQVSTGKCVATFGRGANAHQDMIRALDYNPDGKTIVSASLDGSLKIWQVDSNACIATLRNFDSGCFRISAILSVCHHMMVSIQACGAVHYHPSGKKLVAGYIDSTLKIWDLTRNECTTVLKGHPSPVMTVACSSDGSQVASGKLDGTLEVWDIIQNKSIFLLKAHQDTISKLSYSPDGKTVITGGSGDKMLKIWDIATRTCLTTLEFDRGVQFVAYSPNGETIASVSDKIQVWDMKILQPTMG